MMRYRLLIVGILGLAGCASPPAPSSSRAVDPVSQPCDASQPETTLSSRFRIDEAAGTVFDSKTSLTWKRCAEGQTVLDGHCKGEAGKWAWSDAVARFSGEDSGWRLPSVDELGSIAEKKCPLQAITPSIFPDTPPGWFWSGSVYLGNPAHARVATLHYGQADKQIFAHQETFSYRQKTYAYQVRLVRGAEWMDPTGLLAEERKQSELKKAREVEGAVQRELRQSKEAVQRELRQSKEEEEKRRKEGEAQLKLAELLKAEQAAFVTCPDKVVCDKVFSLTQIYLNQTADMKIQVATDTIVETYNPTEDGKLGLKAVRIPGKGSSGRIMLTATCKNEKGFFVESCRLTKLSSYQGFRPFVERMLKD